MSGSNRRIAVVPFFGGTSEATHSLEETRLGYLEQTLESLSRIGFHPFVYQTTRDSVKIGDAFMVNVEPQWLPWAACKDVQGHLSVQGKIIVSEADQVWHAGDEEVFDIPNDERYLAPWRLDLVGPKREMEEAGSPTYGIGGKEYGISNGAHHLVGADDPWGILPIHGNQAAFSGGYVCTAEFFKRIKFRKHRLLPVEHATGFDANATGLCVRTAQVERLWVDHLSPRDRYLTASQPS